MLLNLPCKTILTLVMVCLCGFAGIAQTTGTVDSTKVRELRINPAAALGDAISPADIFDSIAYVPLETTRKSLFGKIDQMQVLDDHFIIIDESAYSFDSRYYASILIFGPTGKFRARMNSVDFRAMTVDPIKKQIVVLENGGEYLSTFDLDGKRISKIKPPPTYYYSAVIDKNGRMTVYKGTHQDYKGQMETGLPITNTLITMNADLTAHKKYFPMDTTGLDKIYFGPGDRNYLTRSGSEIFFRQPRTFDLYNLTDGGLNKQYHFVFPMVNTLTADFWSGKSFEEQVAYYNAHPKAFYDVGNVYKAGNILSFNLQERAKADLFFLNLKNNLLTAMSSVKPDPASLPVPLTNNIMTSDGTFMYTWLRATPFFSAGSNARTMSISINGQISRGGLAAGTNHAKEYKGNSAELKKFLKEGSARNNPIIVILKVI